MPHRRVPLAIQGSMYRPELSLCPQVLIQCLPANTQLACQCRYVLTSWRWLISHISTGKGEVCPKSDRLMEWCTTHLPQPGESGPAGDVGATSTSSASKKLLQFRSSGFAFHKPCSHYL